MRHRSFLVVKNVVERLCVIVRDDAGFADDTNKQGAVLAQTFYLALHFSGLLDKCIVLRLKFELHFIAIDWCVVAASWVIILILSRLLAFGFLLY